MTSAVAGIGTTFQSGDGASPEIFTTVAEVLSFSGPELSAEEIDVTNLDSSGGFKETIAGLRDAGAVTLELNWHKHASQVSIRDKLAAGTSDNYRITWSDSPSTIADFAGVVTAFSMTTDPNAQITASVTVQITGQVTWT